MSIGEKTWVLLRIVNDEWEAHLLQGLLQGQGIPCRLHSMRVPQYPLTVDGLGEIHLLVPEEALAECQKILASRTGGPAE